MQVRPYRSPDAAAVAALLTELGYPATTREAAAHAARFAAHPGTALLVAVSDDEAVGLVATCLVPRLDADRLSCRIVDLVVAAGGRRRGVGRLLVEAAEAAAREAGATRLDLSTGDWRPDAHAFYARLGFVDNARALVRRLH